MEKLYTVSEKKVGSTPFKRWLLTRKLITTLFTILLLYCIALIPDAYSQSVNLDQGHNGRADDPVSPVEWVNGNANAQNSHFIEGYSIPYRLIMEDLPTGISIHLVLEYDVKEGDHYALDYMTHYQRLESHVQFGHPAEIVDPLHGLDASLYPSGLMSSILIPKPPMLNPQVPNMPGDSWEALEKEGTVVRDMTIYNAIIDSITYPNQADLGQASASQKIMISFKTSSPDVVLSWGGHIASRFDYGEYPDGGPWSAGGINGSPYHMRVDDWNLGNLGNTDRSLKTDAVVVFPPCNIDGLEYICLEGGPYQYTADVTADYDNYSTYSYAWYMISLDETTEILVPDHTETSNTKISTVNIDPTLMPSGFYLKVLITNIQSDVTSTCYYCVDCDDPGNGKTDIKVYDVNVNIIASGNPICSGGEVTLTASSSGGAEPYSYIWEKLNGTFLSSGSNIYTTTISVTTTFVALVTDNLGCTGSDTITVTVDPLPVAIPSSLEVCEHSFEAGEGYFDLTSLNQTVSNSEANRSVVWYSDLLLTIPIGTPDNYLSGNATVYAKVINTLTQCYNSTFVTLTVYQLPICSILGDVDELCPSGVASYSGPGGMSIYSWSIDGAAIITSGENSQTVNIQAKSHEVSCDSSFVLTLNITDENGCSQECERTVIVIDDTAPVFETPPAELAVQCIEDVPAMISLEWTDNCDGSGIVPGSDVSDQNTCPETITRTWAYTDACGNPASVSQTIIVNDDTAPVFVTPPAELTVQCIEDVPAMISLEWTDNCDGSGIAPGNDVSDQNTCPEIITRTWSYTDACGNLASVSQTIIVNDDTAPVFVTPPAELTVQCIEDVPAMISLGWTDNCDGSGIALGNDVSDQNTCPEIITRTWSYTDACGNLASVSQTIIVNDDTAPVFVTPPAELTVQCIEDVPAMISLGWTDNCDGSGIAPGNDVSDQNTCPEIITRTWSYTDACGNLASVSQTIIVNDDTAPVFVTPPAELTVQCIEDVPAMISLGWTDNCDGSGIAPGNDVSDQNTCPEIITRTWSYTDACGNLASVSQTIIVNDDTAPVFVTPPAELTVQCIEDVPAMISLGWTDNCDGSGIAPGNDVSDQNTCPEIITRTWSYTDACGNLASVSQTIIVNDDTAPVFVTPPAELTVQCIEDVPAMISLGWTDNCDGSGIALGNDVSDQNTCPEIITRTWSYTDACGNLASVSQTIIVNDDTAPVFVTPPAELTVQCIEDVPAMISLGWTDNCDGSGIAPGNDVSDQNTCPEIITRTWSYTDACGNLASVSQTIIVNDDTAPVFVTPPAELTVQCIEDVPAMISLGWTDNCDGSGIAPGNDVSDQNTCPEIITRTWSYTDACGNLASVSQTIIVNDDTAPVFVTPPAELTVQCIEDVPAMISLGWTDNCDGSGIAPGNDVSDQNTCPEIITRTWSYTDACGNLASVSQTIIVNDDTAPVFVTPPAELTVQCIEDVPAMISLGWTDNCDGSGIAPGNDVSDQNTCPEIITRTWSYTDACGNLASVSQTIIVNDDTAPVFVTPPAELTVQCIEDVPAMISLGWTDNCDGSGIALGNDVSDQNTCPEIITRTWSYTDACGNLASVSQTIIVNDDTAPVFVTPPAELTVQCIEDVPAMISLGWTDNCDGSGIAPGNDVSDQNTCPEIITRTWSYTDACGNLASVSQTIIVNDDTAPVFVTPPAELTVQCIEDVPAMISLGWTDNCDGSGIAPGNDVSDQNTCPEIITRTWSYTDACGNLASVSQTIIVNDDTAPVFVTPPAELTVQCIEDVPAMISLGWTDNCDGSGIAPGNDVSDQNTCPEIITRTWSYTDACGNLASVSQTIIVNDDTAPVFVTPPAELTVQCIEDVPAMISLGWTDNCDGSGIAPGNDVSDQNTCPEIITRTWSYTDACGNLASVSQTIIVNDDTAPVFVTPPAELTVQCIEDVPAMISLGWTDNCDGSGIAPGNDVSDQNTCPEIITRTWSYTDACGNLASVSQTIIVNDDTAPVFVTPPAELTVQCIEDVPAMISLGWTDNCDGSGIAPGNDVSDQNTCPETIIRTWSYTDACGNPASVSQTIIVNDDTAPVLTVVPLYQYGECNEFTIPMPSVEDNCDDNPEIVATIEGLPVDLATYVFPIGATEIVFTATDACGNESTDISIVELYETPACDISPGEENSLDAVITNLSAYTAEVVDSYWTIDAIGISNGWTIVSDNGLEVIYGTGFGEAIYTLTIIDEFGCENICEYLLIYVEARSHCTYTQGFYGNEGGNSCSTTGQGPTAEELMLNAFDATSTSYERFGVEAPLNVYFELKRTDVVNGDIFIMLPGGGTPKALLGSATYSDPKTWPNVPITMKKGKIKNNLLSQTMTLYFNMENDTELKTLKLEDKFMVTAKSDDCGENIAEPYSALYVTFPEAVIDHLKYKDTYGNVVFGDVEDLYGLAKKMLAGDPEFIENMELGESLPNHPIYAAITPSNVNEAVDAINRGFDECRVLMGFAGSLDEVSQFGEMPDERSTTDDDYYSPDQLEVIDYPNPFEEIVYLNINALEDTHVTLEIYTIEGERIETLINEDMKVDDVKNVKFDSSNYAPGIYLYKIKTDKGILSGKLIKY